MTHLDDNLLTMLRAARPDTGDQPSASSPAATAMLTRILAAPRAPAHRVTRRKLVLTGVPAAAGTAAAVLLATTLTSSGSPSGTASSALPSASHVRTAVLDALQRDSGDIIYQVSTSTGPVAAGRTSRIWTYPAFPVKGQQVRHRLFTFLNGKPTEDTESIYVQNWTSALSLSTTAGPRSAEIIDVQYGTKTWSRQRSSIPIVAVGVSPALIREQIASGRFIVVGRGHVRGHEAIELSWTRSPGRSSQLVLKTTFWVDAHSYVPLSATGTMRLQGNGGHDKLMQSGSTQYQVLPATPANLALLNPPIPPGFTRVPRSPNF
jgi:hypothetical protein